MLQYLILNNHLQSAKAFKHESSLTWKQVLLTSFTKGNRQQFFSIFEMLRKQQKLQFYLRVYFLIYSIHPHINVNARTNAIPQKEINSFREFLDTKGADLAKTSQFLQFYALPFIKKPLEHGTFKTLFGKSWVSNLKDKLNVYIGIEQQSMKNSVKLQFSSSISQNPRQQPKQQPQLVNSPQYEQKFLLLQKKNKQLFEQLQQIKETYHHLQQNHQQMIQDFNQYMMDSQNKWFQSYKQLVKTSRGLLQIVGGLSGDNPKLQRKYIQSKRKIQKYQRFVARKLQDLLSMSQDISVFDKPSVNQISQYTMKSGYTSKSWLNNNYTNNNMTNNNNNLGEKNLLINNYSQLQSINYTRTENQNNVTSYVQIDQYIATNFNKINQLFNSNKQNDDEKIAIIQGFSWRLLKSKTPLVRRYYCISMITSNFLGLGRIDPKSQNKDLQLCTKYLTLNNNTSNKHSPQLTDSLLQLLNYMKVDYYSRQWLFRQNNIVYPLMETMAEQLQQNNLQSFLIAMDILSTISAYKDYRRAIIQTQLPIFLLNILQSYPKLFQSQQLMQLIMMVLMNVSSFPQGIQLLQQYQNIFSTLSVAFQHEYHDIIMLVNGFYYTLLGDRKMYQLAIESNMPEFVKYLLSSEQYKEHQRQLKFIQSRLQSLQNNQLQKHQKEEDLYLIDSQNQYEQIEIIQDQMDNLQQYIRAHQQLTNKYSLYQSQADEQQKHVQSINQQFVKKVQIKKLQLENKKIQQNGRNSFGNNNGNNDHSNKQLVSMKELNNKPTIKNIPAQSKPIVKKPTQQQQLFYNNKDQQIQFSMVDLSHNNFKIHPSLINKKSQVQSNKNKNKFQQNKKNEQQQYTTIKQELFKSPPSKVDAVVKNQLPIPGNSKQAQFMGLMSKEKNPTFAKQKTQGNQKYNSPTVPIADHMNLPNFGSYTPPAQLAPQQKTRRKQLLKQLNEEIQSKQKQKVQRHKSKLQFDQAFQQDKINQKKQTSLKNLQSGPKATRGNAHIKNQDSLKQKPVKEKELQRKAFESRPKIHRTPPKDDQ